ncbi:MAG: LamG domain-containing protein [Desulfobacteraceae bacterium]|nr:hypothetical protein [Desulfobacteraceae bacterium]MBC2754693.1 LamG domain-containing protein [Desulfobacteraceae bacterium]
MKVRLQFPLFLFFVALIFCAVPTCVFAAPASVIHIYEFNSSYADTLGGPAMVPTGPGGSLTAAEYVFGTDDGLSLSNGVNSTEYSIEMLFYISDTSGYVKFIDYKDLTSDDGLYNHNTALNFYDEDEGSAGVINNGATVHVVLTRDADTQQVVGYVNGVQQIVFTDDSADVAVFDAANNIIRFFADDTTTTGEESPGAVDRIRIYSGVLAPSQVTYLYNGGDPGLTPASIPTINEYGMMILLLLMAGSSFWILRQKNNQMV